MPTTSIIKCPFCNFKLKWESETGDLYTDVLAYRKFLKHLVDKHPKKKDYIRKIEEKLDWIEMLWEEEFWAP